MKKVGVKQKNIDNCIRDSIDGTNLFIDDNYILKAEREFIQSLGLAYFPSLNINNQTYRGDLEAEAVIVAICAGFTEQPEFCAEYSQVNYNDSGANDDLTTWLILIIVAIVVLLMFVLLGLYRLWMKKEIMGDVRSEVDQAVNQYYSFDEARQKQGTELPLVNRS